MTIQTADLCDEHGDKVRVVAPMGFRSLGGRGVEVMVGAHSEPERVTYAGVAQEFGLLASRGSDFHDPVESRTDLGALPDLPGRLDPVWLALQHRVQRA